MSKMIFVITFSLIWACELASAQTSLPTKKNTLPEQLAPFDSLIMNKVSHTQVAIKQTRVFLEVYQQEEGKWPESWVDVENKFGASMWEAPEVRQSFTKSFVLLRGVPGHIKTREEREYDSTMMMVMTSPIERKLSQDKHELGRWAVWKTFRGQIVTRWHPEQEITSFSAWPEVQSAVSEHIKAVGRTDESSQSRAPMQTAKAQPPAPNKPPEATPTATTLSEEPTSSTPWSVIVALIVAASGLLWLLLKRRS